MFAKTIIDSDAFLEMPHTTQLLYFHLSMRADDDGFVNNAKNIMRMASCKDDDITILMAKKFIIPFESGVCVIKHWKIHNYIQKDRYTETKYKNEKSMLFLDENKAYTLSKNEECIQSVHEMDTQVRLGKIRLELDKNKDIGDKPPRSQNFSPPTVEEVTNYCNERKNNIDAQRFIDFYESKGWLIGKNKMKDWKAAIRTWEKRDKDGGNGNSSGTAKNEFSGYCTDGLL